MSKVYLNYYQTTATVPTAFITKNKQRLKQYNNNVFLRNGDEFEIELFNPTSKKVLAKIKLNGEYISHGGIVLRPGERVFLERYLDVAKKFKFETYEIDANDRDAKNAIQNNGDVEIEFYDEYYMPNVIITLSPSYYYPTYYTSTSDVNINYNNTTNVNLITAEESTISYNETKNTIETGRIERGSNSNQDFINDYSTFNNYYSHKVYWKILPESQKQYVKEDLKVYCTKCGAKRKKTSHLFCPYCGTKF